MIFQYRLLFDNPVAFAVLFAAFSVSLLTGLIFHEFCHAFVANLLGDPTPKRHGRLTLDPRAHYDPIWTTAIFILGFGMAKPVPIDPRNTANPKQALLLIALAGPLSNLVVAAIAAIPLRLGVAGLSSAGLLSPGGPSASGLLELFLMTVVVLNVTLGVFNLLPIPPLDGSNVLLGLLPRDLELQYARLQPWGFGILMVLIMLPFITGGGFGLRTLLDPPIDFLLRLLGV